ncbi:MAG: translational GTPase TypA, partial [Bacteroidota bacterium]
PDAYLGPLAIGRIMQGTLGQRQQISLCHRDGSTKATQVTELFVNRGLDRERVGSASAGEIVTVAGVAGIGLGESLADAENPQPLPPLHVDEPTLSMEFRINDSPFSGLEGQYVTSRNLRDRLFREAETNLAMKIEETDTPDAFLVFGRGELQMAILIEQMRREGYEFAVGMPRVLTKDIDGRLHEPYEEVQIDVQEEFSGVVVQKLGQRKGLLTRMINGDSGRTRLTFEIPARGLIGYRTEFLTDTKGTGLLNHLFGGYRPWAGDIEHRSTGALVADRDGKATSYAIINLQNRGQLFVGPNEAVYRGMVVGENGRDNDLDVNIVKEKKSTNHRASSAESFEKLVPPKRMSLEEAIEFVRDDEIIEVTPKAFRLRKRYLDPHERKKAMMARG